MNETTQQEKTTTQLGSRNETTQLGSRNETTQLGSRNETTQLGSRNETTQLASRNETTQLVSRNETTQLFRRPPAPPLQQNRLFLPTHGCCHFLHHLDQCRTRKFVHTKSLPHQLLYLTESHLFPGLVWEVVALSKLARPNKVETCPDTGNYKYARPEESCL
ncbi:hypothetical protein TNCV_1882751 [Trichonephila clavipes]|nr:hypothetical protein TNCV_1882751 [Trichonephila clavipes]